MKKIGLAVTLSVVLLLAVPQFVPLGAETPDTVKPKRINKVVELLEAGQPVYYTGAHGGFEEGVKMAQTWADYINYEMEHAPYDVPLLKEFMRGLVAGGPTKSGHRTPAVIVTLPVGGIDEDIMRANYWIVPQLLATGVHGVLLCHARSPEAIEWFVRAARYPIHREGVGNGQLEEGLRGSGGQGFAAEIWGLSRTEYMKKADPWPLNPNGELLLGLKIEDKQALENAERSAKVPGIAFSEWGSGDMSLSFGFLERPDPLPGELQNARARVMAACKAADIAFLNRVTMDTIEDMIREGVKIGSGANPAIADKGRRFSKRKMPW